MPNNIVPLYQPGQTSVENIDTRITPLIDWWGIQPEIPDDIVPGLIPRRMVTLLAGRAGFGKSFLCQMLMSAAAVGADWLGQPVCQCKSLGLFSEDPADRMQPRQDVICKHYGIDYTSLTDVSVITNDDGDFELFSCFRRFGPGTPRTLWKKIELRCIEEGKELIILDNAQNVFSGDQNNPLHVNSFIRYFNSRARELNAAVVLLCNPPKDRSSYFTGIQRWEDSARNTLSLQAPKDMNGKEIDGEFVLKIEKSNYIPYNHPLKRKGITLCWENDILVPRDAEEPIMLDTLGKLDLQARIVKAITHATDVLGWKFAADPLSPNYLPGKLAGQRQWQHVSWADLVNALDRLLSDGKLIKVCVRDAWLIRAPDSQPYLGESKSTL